MRGTRVRNLIGALVPRAPWTGKVIGVFGDAVSILHPDGALVSLVRLGSLMEARSFCHPRGFCGFREKAKTHFDEPGGVTLQAGYTDGSLELFVPEKPG